MVERNRRARVSASGSVCVAVAWALATLACAPDDPRPRGGLEDVLALHERDDVNVLFVLVDTLRADHLHAYGYSRKTSPNLDELAATGIRFADHIAQSSWTKCSMASLWTGLHPNRTGMLRVSNALPEGARLPAEILREAGFRTAAIYRNDWVDEEFGFAQGFEMYLHPVPSFSAIAQHRSEPGHAAMSDAEIIRSASEFMRVHARDRWFLYLHLLDVHEYISDEASAVFGVSYKDFYDNAVLWTDQLMGHLVERLDHYGLRERTLIVFASDHGEAFGEHGAEGHARDVYGEVTETPLILSFPFRLEPGLVVETRTQNVDLWPTLLELLGLPGLEEPDGRSLLPVIAAAAEGEIDPAPPAAFAQIDATWGDRDGEPHPVVAVSDGPWRLVYYGTRPHDSELYDTAVDPKEQLDLAHAESDVAAQLAREAAAYLLRDAAPWGESSTIELEETQLRQLRALGYGIQ